jgi:tRNA threonylcarbamoyladenosine biosynthesis protein TsaB
VSVVLALDTALRRAVVALAAPDGRLLASNAWEAGYRHGEELLPRLRALLERQGVAMADVDGIVVGTGPGAFTGLRVGIATAKALAHGLGRPIVGVSTAAALLDAAGGTGAMLLPAGPSDRVLVADGVAELLPAGTDVPASLAIDLVAVDLPDRAPPEALARGERALAGLAASLVRLGAERLARGDSDDLARLVPEYVTLPRGVTRAVGEVAWSRGLR